MKIRAIHDCHCQKCQSGNEKTQSYHHQLNLLLSRLDERQRRWLVAVEANRIGHGGTEQMRTITGLDIKAWLKSRSHYWSDFLNI